jgi:cyanophycinase
MMNPKGKLLIIGGAEDRADDKPSENAENEGQFERFKILKELLPSGNSKGKIEVITTASSVPDEMEEMYKKTFHDIGYENIGFLFIKDKKQAREEEICKRVQDAKAIFFTGGDQLRISTILGGTPIADIIREKYQHEKGFIVAGTSAGAMVMSEIMICGGGTGEALLGSDLHTASGLGLLGNCIIDTHFIKRGRFSRLAHAIIINPRNLGIGLGEDTALIIHNGNDAECRGSGMVVLIDGADIEQTNISEAGEDCPVYVENLKVHLLTENCRVNLETRKMLAPCTTSQ